MTMRVVVRDVAIMMAPASASCADECVGVVRWDMIPMQGGY